MHYFLSLSLKYRVKFQFSFWRDCRSEILPFQVGTPLCVPSKGGIMLGRIASMEINHKPVEKAKKGDDIALKIEATNADESAKLYGRHFDLKVLSSHVRSSKHKRKIRQQVQPKRTSFLTIVSTFSRFEWLPKQGTQDRKLQALQYVFVSA